MRSLFELVIALAICLVAISLPTTPAQAQEGAYITLSPDSGVPGEEVTVRGYNFTALEWVDIYYYLDTTSRIRVKEFQANSAGSFTVKFPVPESYKGDHKVRADGEDSGYTDADFTVKPGLTVSPEEGPVGTNVTVEGHGFAEDEEGIDLYFDGEMVTENIEEADEDGWWSTSFLIPPSAQGNHKIDARGDDSSLAQVRDATFRVKPGISLEKSSGSVGENITMTGNGFAANERDIRILFAGEEVESDPEIIRADISGYWQASFEVPEIPTGTYNVTADGEETPKEDITPLSFEIVPGLVLSPAEGHVGTNLTVTGGGFATNKDVVVMYEDSEVATDKTNNKGSFEVSFPVPESQHGARQVTAEDAAGNNATAIFTMESDPPETPELISPADGSKVGFVGRVRPTFEWTEVPDDSGVYYSLQIARSENVTSTGFADPIVSVLDIVGTNCTLNATEALAYGTYYWIVQAVDRAGNAGNWTAARSFRAGLLPLWGFIAAIVAIVVLIGTLVYFLVIRRGKYYY